MLIKQEEFIWNFLKNGKANICSCFEYVGFNDNIFLNKNIANKSKLAKIVFVSLFPDYLKPKFVDNENYISKKVIQFGLISGAINLDNVHSVKSYLYDNNQQKLWKNLSRSKNRLEKEYTIKYEYNYGDISKEKCQFLLSELNGMIAKRWGSKIKQHFFIMEWNSNTKDMVNLINEKKSSLFVIYANNKPISISINRIIFKKILFCETHSFDTNFSKYGLGNINNYMRLDWCINNNISFMDLGNGINEIKEKWCNTFYNIYYYIYYKKNNRFYSIIAYIEIAKIKVKNYIKSKTKLLYLVKAAKLFFSK